MMEPHRKASGLGNLVYVHLPNDSTGGSIRARTDLEVEVPKAEDRLLKEDFHGVCVTVPPGDWHHLPSQAHSTTDAAKQLELNLLGERASKRIIEMLGQDTDRG